MPGNSAGEFTWGSRGHELNHLACLFLRKGMLLSYLKPNVLSKVHYTSVENEHVEVENLYDVWS